MLHDRAKIEVRAGRGGDGCHSFRREAHVPKGGPDGGDGGRGGDVVLLCDDSMRDLQSFRHRAHYRADRGGHGKGSLQHGAAGKDLVVKVPPGTQVERADGARYDLVFPGQRAVIAAGGIGGRGNKKFAGPTRQSPHFAERGLEGEEFEVELRLKLLADVGLIGLPNAGKSSLLARMTRALPKVASYPFTTLEPNLGTIDADDRQIVLADIPGLIEGAAEGLGLGHEFLAHVERTGLLVHVLDLAPLDGSDPAANFATIEQELAEYGAGLVELPRMLALSKADLVEPEAFESAREAWTARLGPDVPVLVTSAATGVGLEELRLELLRRVPMRDPQPDDPRLPAAEFAVFRPASDQTYAVEPDGSGGWVVTGAAVDRLIARHDLENDEALAHVEQTLHKMGVVRSLEAAGFEPGDDVEIGGVVFEFDPGGGTR